MLTYLPLIAKYLIYYEPKSCKNHSEALIWPQFFPL